MHSNHRKSHHILHSCVIGLAALLASPSIVVASESLETIEASPATDTECGESTVQIEVDVVNGSVYYVDPDVGNVLLDDDTLYVNFGSQGHVVLNIHYTSSEWDVDITPDEDPTVTYGTSNGWLRYSISSSYDEYVFESTEDTSMSSMMTMVPVVPTIRIRTRAGCP